MPNQVMLWWLWLQNEWKTLQDGWKLYQWYRKNKPAVDAAKKQFDWFRDLWPF